MGGRPELTDEQRALIEPLVAQLRNGEITREEFRQQVQAIVAGE